MLVISLSGSNLCSLDRTWKKKSLNIGQSLHHSFRLLTFLSENLQMSIYRSKRVLILLSTETDRAGWRQALGLSFLANNTHSSLPLLWPMQAGFSKCGLQTEEYVYLKLAGNAVIWYLLNQNLHFNQLPKVKYKCCTPSVLSPWTTLLTNKWIKERNQKMLWVGK